MATPPLAQPEDLAAWVGHDISVTDPRAVALLSAASALVRSYAGQVWVEGEEVPEIAKAVTVQVAARVWVNPAGVTSVTVDDATRRWGEAGTSGLYLTDVDKEALAPYATNPTSGVSTLGTTRGEMPSGAIYVPTGPPPSGPPFPWYSSEDFG